MHTVTILLLSLLWFQQPTRPFLPDLSTPEKTVRGFMQAMHRGDLLHIVAFLQDPRPGVRYKEECDAALKAVDYKYGVLYHMNIVSARSSISGDTATVTLTYTSDPQSQWKNTEKCHLRQTGGQWKIVLPTPEEMRFDQSPPMPEYGFFESLSAVMDLLRQSRGEPEPIPADAWACYHNISKLGPAVGEYLQKNDDIFFFEPEKYEQILQKTGVNESLFHCPDDKQIRYSFNSKLAHVSTAGILYWQRTVLLYEGQGGKLNYHHDGKAFVVLVNLKTRLMDPKEAKALIWNPNGPQEDSEQHK